MRNRHRFIQVVVVALGLLGFSAGAALAQAESPLPDFFKECWSCSFVGQFIQLGDAIAFNVYEMLAESIGKILAMFFGLWTMVQAMKLFVPGTDGYDVLKTLFKRSLLFALVFMMTNDKEATVYREWIYTPLMNVAADGAKAVLGEVKGVSGVPLDTVFKLNESGTTDWFPLQGVDSNSDMTPTITSLLDLVGGMQKINGYGFWAGLKIAMMPQWDIRSWVVRIPAGLLLMLAFGISFIAFPFYVIDLFFRMFLLTAVAPGVIAAFGFGPSRQAAIAAFKGLLQSALTVIMLGIVFVFTGSLMSSVLVMIPEAGSDFDSFLYWLDDKIDAFTFSQSGYWFLLAAGILSTSAVSKARGVVGALIGGFDDGKSMGDKASALAGKGLMMGGGVAANVAGTAAVLGAASAIGALPGAGKVMMGIKGAAQTALNSAGGSIGQARLLKSALTSGGMNSGNPPGGGAQNP